MQAHVDGQSAAVAAEPSLAELAQAEPLVELEPTTLFQHPKRSPYKPPQWAGPLQEDFGVHRNAAPSHEPTSLHLRVK